MIEEEGETTGAAVLIGSDDAEEEEEEALEGLVTVAPLSMLLGGFGVLEDPQEPGSPVVANTNYREGRFMQCCGTDTDAVSAQCDCFAQYIDNVPVPDRYCSVCGEYTGRQSKTLTKGPGCASRICTEWRESGQGTAKRQKKTKG